MTKVGILGGGQLGRMLLQQAANYPVEVSIMEKDIDCPAAKLCHHFILGDITNYDDVISFGEGLDAITIEIENVNIDALYELEKRGCKVYPSPDALKTIKNKILQKQFYSIHNIPTPAFHVIGSRDELHQHIDFLPAVHKLATGGYDGKGVQILNNSSEINLGFDAPSVLEKMVLIVKELAVTVAVGNNGATALYPPVEMVFNQSLNLLDYQICPANIPENILWKAEALALSVARNLKSPGIFAVEMFTDKENYVWVNETAPRVHNSGHHTIEAHYSSQFDMLWRIILNYPLGNTNKIMSSVMVNLVGAEGYAGNAVYEGLAEVLAIPDAYVHLYGKTETKPGRKMGHATIISDERQELLHQANKIKHTLFIKGDKKI
jgi:5-(carboxyamino)imidazole ribonucleotide synthase